MRWRFWRWFCEGEVEPDSPATEALAATLECFGRYAFDLPDQRAREIQSRFQKLAQQARDGQAQGIPERVCEHRRAEQAFVAQSLNDLRDLTWQLISGMARILQEDGEGDRAVRQQIQKIAESPPTEVQVLKQALTALTQMLEERERRHKQTLQQMQSQMGQLLQELEQARKESHIDPLTGLYNRRALEHHLQSTVELNRLFGYSAALILIDIDDFKRLNDTWGHTTGDEVLKAVAEVLVRVCKRKGDFVARYGGEEFAIVLRETTLKEAKTITQKILDAVRREVFQLPDGNLLTITVSAGVSVLQEMEEARAWLERTDQLLYAAKRAGKNQLQAA